MRTQRSGTDLCADELQMDISWADGLLHRHKLYCNSGWSRWWDGNVVYPMWITSLCISTEISSLSVNLRWNRHCSHCIPDLFVTYPWFNHSGIHRRRPLVRLQNIKQHRQQLEEAATCALTRSSIWSPRFRWCTVVCVRLYGNVSCTGFSYRLSPTWNRIVESTCTLGLLLFGCGQLSCGIQLHLLSHLYSRGRFAVCSGLWISMYCQLISVDYMNFMVTFLFKNLLLVDLCGFMNCCCCRSWSNCCNFCNSCDGMAEIETHAFTLLTLLVSAICIALLRA